MSIDISFLIPTLEKLEEGTNLQKVVDSINAQPTKYTYEICIVPHDGQCRLRTLPVGLFIRHSGVTLPFQVIIESVTLYLFETTGDLRFRGYGNSPASRRT